MCTSALSFVFVCFCFLFAFVFVCFCFLFAFVFVCFCFCLFLFLFAFVFFCFLLYSAGVQVIYRAYFFENFFENFSMDIAALTCLEIMHH